MRRRKGSRKGLNKLPGGCWQTTNQLRRLSSTPASPKSKSEHCNTKRTKELTLVLFIFRHSLLRRERQGCHSSGSNVRITIFEQLSSYKQILIQDSLYLLATRLNLERTKGTESSIRRAFLCGCPHYGNPAMLFLKTPIGQLACFHLEDAWQYLTVHPKAAANHYRIPPVYLKAFQNSILPNSSSYYYTCLRDSLSGLSRQLHGHRAHAVGVGSVFAYHWIQ